jgi:hypothetical protein
MATRTGRYCLNYFDKSTKIYELTTGEAELVFKTATRLVSSCSFVFWATEGSYDGKIYTTKQGTLQLIKKYLHGDTDANAAHRKQVAYAV